MGGRYYSDQSPFPILSLDLDRYGSRVVLAEPVPLVGPVRLSVRPLPGYPPDAPGSGGYTPPGPVIVGVAGPLVADQARAPTVGPTVDPTGWIDRLSRLGAQMAPAAG